MNVQSASIPNAEVETSKTTDQLWNLLQNVNSKNHRRTTRDTREMMDYEISEAQNEPKGFHFARKHIAMPPTQENYSQFHGNFQGRITNQAQSEQNQINQPQSPHYFQQSANQNPGLRGGKANGIHFMPPATHHTWFPGDQASIFQSSMVQRNRKYSHSRENTSSPSLPFSRPTEGQFTEGYPSSERRNSIRYEKINKSSTSQGHNQVTTDKGFHFGASSGFVPNRPTMSTIATQTEPVHCIPLRPSSITANSVPVSQHQINQSHGLADYHMSSSNQRTRHHSHDNVFENMKNRPTEMISLLSPQYHHPQSNCHQQPQMSPMSPCQAVPSPSSNHSQPKFVFEQVDSRSPQCGSEPRSPPNKLRILLENGHHFAKSRVIQQPVESSVQYDPPPMRKFSGLYRFCRNAL